MQTFNSNLTKNCDITVPEEWGKDKNYGLGNMCTETHLSKQEINIISKIKK